MFPFFKLLFLAALIFFGLYHYFSEKLEKKANKMLDYAVITKSINDRYYLGFIEDCSGTLSEKKTSHCFRKIYYYKNQTERGLCTLPGGTVASSMFENLTLTWKNFNHLELHSTFGTIPLLINNTTCNNTDSVFDRFELIPTYEATVEKLKQQNLENLIEKNRDLMEKAKRQIKID